MNDILNPEAVEAVFKACLHDEGDEDSYIEVWGITMKARFDPARVERYKSAIEAMLDELPDEFKASGGGGWSFLNALNDKHGEQWTGLHLRMDQLFMLGTAIDKVKPLMPREMWKVLPGGMPYYIIS